MKSFATIVAKLFTLDVCGYAYRVLLLPIKKECFCLSFFAVEYMWFVWELEQYDYITYRNKKITWNLKLTCFSSLVMGNSWSVNQILADLINYPPKLRSSGRLNPFYSNLIILYCLKTSENHWFSDVFGGYRNVTLD